MKSIKGQEVKWLKFIIECDGKSKEFNKEGVAMDYKRSLEKKGKVVKVYYEDEKTERMEICNKK